MHRYKKLIGYLTLLIVISSFYHVSTYKEKPVIYIIGDSTVRNSSGIGGPGQWGWGTFLADFFDSTRIEVKNHAMAGRSTRTFIKEGRWEKVLSELKPGDFVIVQFGHNEGSTPDTTRAGYRGVLRGTGEETQELVWPDGTRETVHTYGWYLQKFITETKAKGAHSIVASMIPRNKFVDSDVERANQDFGKWAQQVSRKTGADFIDLNAIVADQYDEWGPEVVKGLFEKDHTHTNEAGARINAWSLVKGIKELDKNPLQTYLKKGKPTLFLVGDSTVKNGEGDGAGGLWGWGDFLSAHFDTDKLKIQNHALGGTSSRTFQTYGHWDRVVDKLRPGDYVIMQFGHNDSSPLDDEARARGTIKGSGLEAQYIHNPITKQQETVYTYGQYLRNMIIQAKAKGATPIVCSPIPRNSWNDGKVNRASNDYGLWAWETAEQTHSSFIDLNRIIAEGYDTLGESLVRKQYFNETDHTHTIKKGAVYNAAAVVTGIRGLSNLGLYEYLENSTVDGPPTTTNIIKATKPLYEDPIYQGAADPVIVWNGDEEKWFMFYTNRRASDTTAVGVEWVHGTRIGISESTNGVEWVYRDTANINYRPYKDITHWAPEVIEHDGTYHMYLTVVPGIFRDWNHPRNIIHLTSSDLLNWDYVSTLDLVNDKVIDADVFKMPDGSWRMWYNNERDGKSIYYADSKNLYHWEDKGKAVESRGEGPVVFKWRGYYWMVIDQWKGLGVYRSDDLDNWTLQEERLVELPGVGKDNQAIGGHADVVVSESRAFLYYFTHPGRNPNDPAPDNSFGAKRSVIQVSELKFLDGKLMTDRDEEVVFSLRW